MSSSTLHERVPKRFVGLHGHSGFSTFDGLGLPKEHMDFVLKNGMDAWALTDHGHMNAYAHAMHHKWELDKKGVDFKFIPGCEFYVHPDLSSWRLDYEKARSERADRRRKSADDDDSGTIVEDESDSKRSKWFDPVRRRHHLVVLAKTDRGLKNLFRLISMSYIDGFYRFPRIDYSMLKRFGDDLVVSTACLAGPLSYDVMRHHSDVEWTDMYPGIGDETTYEDIQRDLANTVDSLVDAVGQENLFLELQFNKLAPQHLVNMHLIELSKRTGVDLIVTTDSHYPDPTMWKDRELYKKLGWLSKDKFEPGILPQSPDELECELYPKNATQLWDSYRETVDVIKERYPDANVDFYDDDVICDAIERTYDIAHDLIGDVNPDTSIKLPRYVIPKDDDGHVKDEFEALVDAVKEGLRKKGLDTKREYIERAKEELAVIKEKKFSLYFLTMKTIMDIANQHMLTGPGRGSGAGSLVNYILGITHVDPIKYGLLFARFISRARDGYPDIDSDVADNDLLKDLLRKEFGVENVIPISNYNRLALKSLIKDLSKFYGIPFEEVNEATKSLEKDVMKAVMKKGDDKNVFVLTYEDAIKHSEKFRKFIERYPHVGEHVKVLFKQNKSIGRHAGGVIVAENIRENMPLIKVRNELQTPWTEGLSYRHLEPLGFIKVDLLGLKTLRIIQRCIDLIIRRRGLYEVELGDETFRVLGDRRVTLRDGTVKCVNELSHDDDVVELEGLWSER